MICRNGSVQSESRRNQIPEAAVIGLTKLRFELGEHHHHLEILRSLYDAYEFSL